MNQVALPESQPDPEATPAVGMRARLLALAAVCVVGGLALAGGAGAVPGLARAAIGRERRADGRARHRQRGRPGDRDLDRADGGPRYLAGAARGGSEGVLWSARRDAAARRNVVRPLGPGTAAAEHAPAIWRLPAAARRLQCPGARQPYETHLRDTPDHGQPGGLGSRGTDIRHLGHGPRRGRR